jgi:hypothetical protein
VSPALAWLAVAAAGVAIALGGALLVRASGASPGRARRLAGARGARVGELTEAPPSRRPMRVSGRVRCSDPVVTPDGQRLIAFHRDVEVRSGREWRTVERIRETRAFDLWDHDGWVRLDLADAAEPLITIPHVWRGAVSELEEPLRGAAVRVAGEDPSRAEARAVTRTVSVIDRLLVLARVERQGAGAVRLVAPQGGFIVSAVPLDAAMRLLGGGRPRLLLGGVSAIAVGIVIALVGVLAGIASALAG